MTSLIVGPGFFKCGSTTVIEEIIPELDIHVPRKRPPGRWGALLGRIPGAPGRRRSELRLARAIDYLTCHTRCAPEVIAAELRTLRSDAGQRPVYLEIGFCRTGVDPDRWQTLKAAATAAGFERVRAILYVRRPADLIRSRLDHDVRVSGHFHEHRPTTLTRAYLEARLATAPKIGLSCSYPFCLQTVPEARVPTACLGACRESPHKLYSLETFSFQRLHENCARQLEANDVLVQPLELLRRDPVAWRRRLHDFLGLGTAPVPEGWQPRPANTTATADRSELADDAAAWLDDYYASELASLSDQIGLDLVELFGSGGPAR